MLLLWLRLLLENPPSICLCPSQCCAHLLRAIVLASPRIDRHVRASYADSILCNCPLSPAVMLDDLSIAQVGVSVTRAMKYRPGPEAFTDEDARILLTKVTR